MGLEGIKDYTLENDFCYSHSDINMVVDRCSYIGGSEAEAFGAEIIDEKPKFKSPFMIWCDKVSGEKIEHSDFTKRIFAIGHICETIMRDQAIEILEKYGIQVSKICSSKHTYHLKSHPFVGANLDGFVFLENQEICGLEVKTTRIEKDWLDGKFPYYYNSQVQHYMLVTGLPRFIVICKIISRDEDDSYYVVRLVDSDPIYQQELLKKYIDFWGSVQKKLMPCPGGFPFEKDYIKKFQPYFKDETKSILLDELFSCREKAHKLDVRMNEIRDELEGFLNENNVNCVVAGGLIFRLCKSSRIKFDLESLKEEKSDIYKMLVDNFSETIEIKYRTISKLK